MKYTIKDLQKDFPNDEVCLDYIFAQKYPTVKQYCRVTGRKCYANPQGHQIHPLAGTIFEKSSTSLTTWFHVIFLFSTSKNGVSAKEVQRQTGVTYKTAWRMCHQIRKLMEQHKDLLTGTVEVDETYFGKKGTNQTKFKNKSAVMGMVERKGKVRATTISERATHVILNELKENVSTEAHLMTDEFKVYKKAAHLGYTRSGIKHGRKHYVRGNVHTNTIEGFWGQFKRSVRGTHHWVSKTHLQKYLDEFAFRYNLRASSAPIFEVLLKRV